MNATLKIQLQLSDQIRSWSPPFALPPRPAPLHVPLLATLQALGSSSSTPAGCLQVANEGAAVGDHAAIDACVYARFWVLNCTSLPLQLRQGDTVAAKQCEPYERCEE